jgi:hypothetical protein
MTIDIVIPTCGRRSLERLLTALAEQGPIPGSLILVDDRPSGAADDLPRLVPLSLRPALRVVRADARGPAAARNQGWRASRADWIAFLDDDVVPDADWLRRLAEDLRGLSPSIAASQGSLTVPVPARATDWERDVGGLASAAYITADMAFRREALAAANGFDERFRRAFREDAELAYRLIAAGWLIVRGARSVVHPVPRADRLISVRRQRGNADDALMRALHGPRWRQLAHAPAGRRPRHLATTAAALASGLAIVLGRRALAMASLSAWAAGTLELAVARVRPGPRSAGEITTMAITSVLLPPVATAHWLRGAIRWRLLERPRALATAPPPALDRHDADLASGLPG